MNAEFQRIARRDKKAFLSDQCKEIEENNRMGKTSTLFKKIGDIKGIFQARTGTIKGRDGKDIKELYQKELHDPDNHNGIIIHLEPDILE